MIDEPKDEIERSVIHTKRILFFSFMFHFAMDHLPDRCDDVKENFHLQRVQCGGAAKFGKVKIEKVFAGRAFTAISQL